jgi:hypothetical protein
MIQQYIMKINLIKDKEMHKNIVYLLYDKRNKNMHYVQKRN